MDLPGHNLAAALRKIAQRIETSDTFIHDSVKGGALVGAAGLRSFVVLARSNATVNSALMEFHLRSLLEDYVSAYAYTCALMAEHEKAGTSVDILEIPRLD